MKILLANKYFFIKGGAENSFFATTRLLEKKEHQVIPFSMRHARNHSSPYSDYFVSHIDFEDRSLATVLKTPRIFYSFEAKRKIKALIDRENPDIAHLNNIYHQISPSIIHALKKNKIPVVMSLHDYKMVCASYSMLAGDTICEACAGGRYYNALLNSTLAIF
jgi:hypothetical protein